MKDSAAITSMPLAGTIVSKVLQAIVDKKIPAGAKLGEDQLARAFSVSRTVVRQALDRLAHIGVVRQVANRGSFVTRPTEREIEDIYAARRAVELAIVADAARFATSGDIRLLRRHVEEQRKAHAASSRQEYVRLLTEFHTEIAKIGGNTILQEMLSLLLPRTMLLFSYFETQGDGCELDDHDELITFISKGDVGAAQRLMDKHLSHNREAIRIDAGPAPEIDLVELFK